MKAARFSYHRVGGVPEALEWLAHYEGEAKVLAGGQSLVPLLNMRLARPAALVDVNGVPGLAEIRQAGGALAIGALARHADVTTSALVGSRAPLLAVAARHVGHRAIRNRGTVGGSLAHADPAAELPAAAVALDAALTVVGPNGTRTVPAESFFLGLFTTDLGPDELLTEVRVPGLDGAAWGFAELARRPGDFAIVGIAGVLRPDPEERGRCASARLVAFGIDDRPVRLDAAEAELAGRVVDARVASRAGRLAAEAGEPGDDLHASAGYRRHLASALTEQVVLEAATRLVGDVSEAR